MQPNDRIKELRQLLNLSQAKFAKELSISNGHIANIELGDRNVNDRFLKLIAITFNVNEHWLKTGEGEIFVAPKDEKLERAMSIFKNLSPEFQDYALKQIDNLLELQKNQTK